MTGAPQNAARDEALIKLVQSLPVGSPQRAAAYEELVRRYEFVVKASVRRYRDSPEPEEDLMQVGYLGLRPGARSACAQHGRPSRDVGCSGTYERAAGAPKRVGSPALHM